MAALCAPAARPSVVSAAAEPRRAARGAWQAPRPPGDALLDQPGPCPAVSRRLNIRTQAAPGAASATPASPRGLATYSFNLRRGGTSAEWFQTAVRDIVKQVDSQAPFLQTVQLGSGGAPPTLETHGVVDSVVAAPELWQGIAEHVSQSSPDCVILVQRVSPHAACSPQGAMDAAEAEQQQRGHDHAAAASGSAHSSCFDGSSPPGSPRSPRATRSPPAEEACRRLVDSGLADAVLLGQVGDCCDGSGHSHSQGGGDAVAEPRQASQASPSRQLVPTIVPFGPGSSSTARRTAVRAAALRPPGAPAPGAGACQQSACFWGVVVQAPEHTGVAGCYLLKTVKNTTPGTGCTCTHFSLTRISSGEHLEQQFVQSWLV